MNHVIARIGISTPTGRRLLKELEKHQKTVYSRISFAG
jgi:hypothetical protein